MEAEPKQRSSSSKHAARNDRVRAVDDEAAIETLYEMLSSGGSLAEVLVTAKRLKSGVDGRPGTDIQRAEDVARSARTRWKTTPVDEPVELNFADSSGALAGDTINDAPSMNVQTASRSAPSERGWGKRLSRLSAATLLWLIPTVSIVIMGVAARALLDADLTRTAEEATALLKAIPSAIQLERNGSAPSPTSAEAAIKEAPFPAGEVSPTVPERTREQTETVRPSERDVTGSPEAPAVKAATAAPASTQDRGSLDIGTSKPAAEAENSTPRTPASLTVSEPAPAQREPVRAAEQVVTGSPTEASAEAATAKQRSFQDRGLPSGQTGKRTHAPHVHSAPARWTKKGQTRIKRRTNVPMCPQFGHCLTPP